MPTSADLVRSKGALVGVVVATALTALAPAAPVRVSAGQATFRSVTEAVWVTATVIDKDGRLVTDLTKDDFEIRENGELREVTVFRNDAMPFSLAIMLDISGSMMSNLYLMRQGVEELVAQFKPGDRASVGTFTGVARVSPRSTSNPQTLASWVSSSTMAGAALPCPVVNWKILWAAPFGERATALWDGIVCGIDAVAGDGETPRRVVVVVTDGFDQVSTRDASDVRQAADRYGIMVYAIGMWGSQGVEAGVLRSIAEQTGGGYFQLTDRGDLPATFARVAEELRHQYIFGYARTGTTSRNAALEVRVRRPDVTTRARRVDVTEVPTLARPTEVAEAAPVPTALPMPAAPARARADRGTAMATLVDRYSRGEWSASGVDPMSAEQLLSVARDLRRAAPGWIGPRGAEGEARRRLAVATYVIDLLDVNYLVAWLPGVGVELLEWACDLVRDGGPPTPAEKSWHVASLALMERFENGLATHAGHGNRRFPDDGHWAIARAIARELTTWPERRDWASFSLGQQHYEYVGSGFREAAENGAARAEAHLRWGYFELRLEHREAALAHFEQVGTPDDPILRYWLHLFRGRALEQLKRTGEAVVSYERAFAEIPYAQSATLALGTALVADRRGAEAAALVTRMLTVDPPADPWLFYTFPDYRSWPTLLADLRKAIAP